MRGWDEFSEFLLENRVPTSADFNTYPIRIFISNFIFLKCGHVMMWIRYICSCWYIARYALIAITC